MLTVPYTHDVGKYTIVGIIDFIMGVPLVIQALLMGLFTVPKVATLYSESGIDIIPILLRTYISLVIIVLLGIINLFFGYKLMSGIVETKENYFKFGVISAVITLVLAGVLIGFTTLSVLLPVYQLTTSIK